MSDERRFPGTEVMFDPDYGSMVMNESDVAEGEIVDALEDQGGENGRLIASMIRWSQQTQVQTRQGNLFERHKYMTPHAIYDQMRVAYYAMENDDVVSAVADTTEALAFNSMSFWHEDADEQDIWNQIAADLDLDARLREMWREDFAVSQFYVGVYWGQKTYKVRGQGDKGKPRRKSYALNVPLGLTIMDPLKIVPLGMSLFGQDSLCYMANRGEDDVINAVLDGRTEDPILRSFILGPYEPSLPEKQWLGTHNLQSDRLYLLNPQNVWRYTQTKPGYERVAAVRMKSVFELLDMKNQLKQMDRAHLIGGTNFIVLIKKGTEKQPAQPAEVTHLQEQVRTVARVPVIVGDHRLSVEIVTPKLDTTLDGKRYDVIDGRITARLYGMFVLGGSRTSIGGATDDSAKLSKVIAKGMESRRKMIRRALEKNILNTVVERNSKILTTKPTMQFHPAQIALGFDNAWASFLLEARASREISRDTLLSMFDLDQQDEFIRLKREADEYDDTFMTQVPFSTPAGPSNGGGAPADTTGTPAGKRRAGRAGGGTRNGGGAAPGTNQGNSEGTTR